MKKLLFVFAALVISLQGFSQLKLGIKAGAETTTVPTYNFQTGDNNIEALKDANWGFQAGLFLRATLGPVYLQPEVLFASTTYDYNVKTSPSAVAVVKEQKFSRLSVPIMIGVKFGPVRINAGPAANVMIGSPEALIDDPDFENMYKTAVWGYQAGVGLDLLKKLTIDLRYAGSLGEKFGDSATIGSQNFQLDYGQSSFIISLGYMF